MNLKISGLRKELSPASRRVNSKNRFQGWETTWNATGNTSHPGLLLLLLCRPWNIAEEDFLLLSQKGAAYLVAGPGTNWPLEVSFFPGLLATYAAWLRETTYPTIVGSKRKGCATSELCDIGWAGYLTSLDFSVLTCIMDIIMPLHVMKRIKQNECVSKNRGWESRKEGWQGLATPMGTSKNGEGFYQCLGSGHAGSQARLPGSQHRHRTTEGPSANKQTNK